MTAALAIVERAQPELHVSLRRADATDCERVYEYNFAADVRAVSGTHDRVSLENHTLWYRARIADPASPIWIIERGGRACGTVRIDALPGSNPKISIALAANARGRGVGRRAIELACLRWCGAVIAEIHESNAASRACFMACGFSKIGRRGELDVFLWSP